MRKSAFFVIGFMLFVSLFVACQKVPKGVVSPGKMEDILYDSYLGDAISESELGALYGDKARSVYLMSVLKKYDVTRQEYDSSLHWYMGNLNLYSKIYEKVIIRLKKEQSKRELEAGNLLNPGISAPGDSIDVWYQNKTALLSQSFAFRKFYSEINSDENFNPGDTLRFGANVRIFKTSGAQLPKMVLSFIYTNDSVYTVSKEIRESGNVVLTLTSDSIIRIDRIIAGVYQNQPGIVLLDSIKLVRFHKRK